MYLLQLERADSVPKQVNHSWPFVPIQVLRTLGTPSQYHSATVLQSLYNIGPALVRKVQDVAGSPSVTNPEYSVVWSLYRVRVRSTEYGVQPVILRRSSSIDSDESFRTSSSSSSINSTIGSLRVQGAAAVQPVHDVNHRRTFFLQHSFLLADACDCSIDPLVPLSASPALWEERVRWLEMGNMRIGTRRRGASRLDIL